LTEGRWEDVRAFIECIVNRNTGLKQKIPNKRKYKKGSLGLLEKWVGFIKKRQNYPPTYSVATKIARRPEKQDEKVKELVIKYVPEKPLGFH
jgi:hypothetical protein